MSHSASTRASATGSEPWSPWVHAGLLTALVVASRLPQLASPHLALDGDEAVVALMGKHVLDGEGLPLFFYGQRYGLTLFEALLAAATFGVWKFGALPLKVASCGMWVACVLAGYWAASRLATRRIGLWAAAALAVAPAWGVRALKARGGYHTALLASFAIVGLLASGPGRRSALRWAGVGALLALAVYSQPLWIFGLGPIVAWRWLESRSWPDAGGALVGALAVVVAVELTRNVEVGASLWQGPSPADMRPLHNLQRLPRTLFASLAGTYDLRRYLPTGTFVEVATAAWALLIPLGLALQAVRVRARRFLPWSHVLGLSVLACLVAPLLLGRYVPPRYFLPLTGFLVLWAAVEAGDWIRLAPATAKPIAAGAAALLLLSAIAMIQLRSYHELPAVTGDRSEVERLAAVVERLDRSGVRAVFTTDRSLQWRLVVASGEHISARWTSPRERTQRYAEATSAAFATGRPTALVGRVDRFPEPLRALSAGRVETVGDRYFLVEAPSRELLDSLGFRF